MPRNRFFTDDQCRMIKEKGFLYATIYSRVAKRGMSFEDAINKPLERVPLTPEQKQRAKENGIDMKNVYNRRRLGWTDEQAITIPINAHCLLTEEELSIAKENGVSMSMIENRFYTLGWTLEEAITIPKNGKYGKGDRWIK